MGRIITLMLLLLNLGLQCVQELPGCSITEKRLLCPQGKKLKVLKVKYMV